MKRGKETERDKNKRPTQKAEKDVKIAPLQQASFIKSNKLKIKSGLEWRWNECLPFVEIEYVEKLNLTLV
jgi:hypothetical protein